MSVVRYKSLLRGRVTGSIEVHVKNHPKWGWVPDSWTVANHATEKDILTHSCNLAGLTLNHDVPDRMFSLEFPPGTVVSEYAARNMFLVRDDGTAWLIPATGGRKPYTEWVRRSRAMILSSAFRKAIRRSWERKG